MGEGLRLHRHAEDLAVFGEDIFDHAEIGFREERTATKIADELRRLGMQQHARQIDWN